MAFFLQRMETIYICNSKILNVQITLGFRSTSYHTIKPYSTEQMYIVSILCKKNKIKAIAKF
jgi:hypothetical protein